MAMESERPACSSQTDATLEQLLADCPDIFGSMGLPELRRLHAEGRIQLIHRDPDSFQIRLTRK